MGLGRIQRLNSDSPPRIGMKIMRIFPK
jgi:hypothetical protein